MNVVLFMNDASERNVQKAKLYNFYSFRINFDVAQK